MPIKRPGAKKGTATPFVIFRLNQREKKDLQHLAERYAAGNMSEMLRRLLAEKINREVRKGKTG